jgi:hypothetical protein
MYAFNAHKMVKNCIWSVCLWITWTVAKYEERVVNAFEIWCWRRMLIIKWTARITNDEVFQRVKEERSLKSIKK